MSQGFVNEFATFTCFDCGKKLDRNKWWIRLGKCHYCKTCHDLRAMLIKHSGNILNEYFLNDDSSPEPTFKEWILNKRTRELIIIINKKQYEIQIT